MPFKMSGNDQQGKSGFLRRTTAQKADKQQKLANVLKNAIRPVSSGGAIKGSLVYVALEVAVSKLLRTIMGADTKSAMELATVHTISLGLMGGLSAPLNNPIEGVVHPGVKSISRHITQGAKGIPALFLAQYIYQTFFNGFSMSFWSMKDALIMMAAKILTRPIGSKLLYNNVKFAQNSLDNQYIMEQLQVGASNFNRIPEKDRYKRV